MLAGVELKEQPFAPTLAQKLGDAAHVSGLAILLARACGAGERLPEWLLKVAVARGATHYQRDFDPALPPDKRALGLLTCTSDDALYVALDEGTKAEPVEVVYARSFSACRSCRAIST